MSPPASPKPQAGWKRKVYEIIFEADTPAGKSFDVVLLVMIVLSVMAVMLESVPSIRAEHGSWLVIAELGFTIVFTIEYIARLTVSPHPLRYAFSFFGLVDLLSCLPTYIQLFFPATGGNRLLVVRILRLLRTFRVLKMVNHSSEAMRLMKALQSSRQKILVFLFTVLSLAVIVGTLLHLIEPPEAGFTSIPTSVYWAIVTVTTVGYGDIAPVTPLGQIIASATMICAFAIIAVPTGIVYSELRREEDHLDDHQTCSNCGITRHVKNAKFCQRCGCPLPEIQFQPLEPQPTPERKVHKDE